VDLRKSRRIFEQLHSSSSQPRPIWKTEFSHKRHRRHKIVLYFFVPFVANPLIKT
jgi:hypothetical protein